MTVSRSNERRAVDLLTGPSAGDMLAVALRGDGVVRSWHVHAVNHRPGASVSVGYSVVWDRFHGDDRERRVREDLYLVATTATIRPDRLARADAKTLYADAMPVHLWEFPNDPELPALELACDPEPLSTFVGQRVDVELLGYRPTRRAVLRVEGEDENFYAKVVRPGAREALLHRHTAFEKARLPTPRVAKSNADGLVLTTAVTGTPLSQIYVRGGNLDVTFASLSATLEALPLIGLGLKRRPAWAERCEHYAHAASVSLPDIADRVGAAASEIRRYRAEADYGPIVPTHGDFYEANVLVSPSTGRVSGLLDLDTFGPGYRADDWGCLLGHLSVLPSLNSKYKNVGAITDRWFERARTEVDPVALAASAAGVALSLVASARQRGRSNWKKQALARLDVVEAWLVTAREAERDAGYGPRLTAVR